MTTSPIDPDGRRASGERTRRRLLDATRALMAERGGGEVSLREIAAAAGANIASVRYHFGDKRQLCSAAIDEALRTTVDQQIARYRRLPDAPTLAEIAVAFADPILDGLSGTDREQRELMRILARVISDPGPEGRARYAATLAEGQDLLRSRLKLVLQRASEAELDIRVAAAGAIVQAYALDRLDHELHGAAPEDVRRLLMPVIAGALSGGLASPRASC